MSCIDQLSKDAKERLFSSIFSKNYFLWIGSGFSYNFGFGSWEDVLKAISRKLKYPLELNVSNPLKAAELLCSFASSHHGYDEYKFNSLVAECLLESKKACKDPEWTRRFRAFSPNMVVTTNWDNQLEKIYDGLVNVVVRKDKSPQVSSKGRNLFKIHGDAGRPASIVVTQSQYFSFQREDTYLNRKIYTLFSEASPIFIGYSLTDPNIGFLYDEVYAHLGEEKPPAYMVVHPTVDDRVLEESRLLFNNKNIHIIKAEIGEFLEDLASEYKEYKHSARRFIDEHRNILERLKEAIELVKTNKNIESEDILGVFNSRDSRHQAITAFVEILSNQMLYKEFGGEILSPENRMSYRAIDQLVGAIIWLVNKESHPNPEVRESFHSSVLKLCAHTDGVWDFYTAESPFTNILRISPRKDSESFKPRIAHILKVLRWSAPSEIGKCWSTWNAYVRHLNWLKETDIGEIINHLTNDEDNKYKKSDQKWLEKLKNSNHCTDILKKSIDSLLIRT
jgi:hypothetical protein